MSAWLEHKIPPPLVGLMVAAAMGAVVAAGGVWALPQLSWRNGLVALLLATGLAFDLAGLLAFWARKTTINPLRPERASALVTHGIYRITRNPMYVGMVFLLLAWGFYLADAAAILLGPAVYVVYLNRFQIAPEERTLLDLFGQPYRDYMDKVRRWL